MYGAVKPYLYGHRPKHLKKRSYQRGVRIN